MTQHITRTQLYNGFKLASENLTNNQNLLNSINVFPVPDQDTGKNMSMSMASAYEVLTDDMNVVEICDQVSRSLFSQGRGNSGTLLSLFFQGFARTIIDRLGDACDHDTLIDGQTLARGFANGAINAFNGMSDPMDGTILTISQKAGEEGLDYNTGSTSASDVMTRMTEKAYEVLPLTAIQNPVCAEHKVIDSGALGFCMIMDGLEAAFRDDEEVTREYDFIDGLSSAITPQELEYNFCTEFIISKVGSETPDIIRKQLADIGDCIIPIDSGNELKIHVHTNNPDAAFFIASLCGPIKRTKVENMLSQSRSSGASVNMFLCQDEMTQLGLMSMEYDNVFIDSDALDEFFESAKKLTESGCRITLFSSVSISGEEAEIFPVIRYFSSDDDLLGYVYTI